MTRWIAQMLLVVAVLLMQPPLASPQQERSSLRGSVVNSVSGAPLGGTRVELMRTSGANVAATATTASDGSFVLSDVPPGQYRLVASRLDGYLSAEYGQRQPTIRGMTIAVEPGESLRDLQIRMAPLGVISGRILDRDGQPVGRAAVQALQSFYKDGRREFTIAQSVLTNDLGDYRLYWLPPGQYYLTTTPIDPNARSLTLYIRRPEENLNYREAQQPAISRQLNARGDVVERVFMPVFYPGTTDVQRATAIPLRAGETLTGLQINIPDAPIARHIRGRVSNYTKGQPTYVSAVPRIAGASVVVPNAIVDSNGAFDIAGVAPGSYYLFVTATPIGAPASGGGRILVDVADADLDAVSLALTPVFDVPGRFVMEGHSDLALSALRVAVQRDPDVVGMPFAQANGNPIQTARDGSFTLTGLGAGDYRLLIGVGRLTSVVTVPDGTYIRSIRLGEADVLNSGLNLDGPPAGTLEIVLAGNAGVITGAVVNNRREAVGNVHVALVPDGPLRNRKDLYRNTASDSLGQFLITSIAPGNYKLFAWEDVEVGAWMDPEFLRSSEGRGMFIRVEEASTQELQLPMIEASR